MILCSTVESPNMYSFIFPGKLKSLCRFMLIFGLFCVCVNSYGQISSMGEAINTAGKQRMLSQRIAQSFLLVAIQAENPYGRKLLTRSVNDFEDNLKNLQSYPATKSLSMHIVPVKKLWADYRRVATSVPSKQTARHLLKLCDELLLASDNYVKKLEELTGEKEAELINISGRQRMLSQRIAKNFLARYWKINVEQANQVLYEDLAEYESVMEYLLQSPLNTKEITVQLRKVKGYFSFASKGFDGVMELSENRLIHVVTGTTDYMLRGMDVATKMYSKTL